MPFGSAPSAAARAGSRGLGRTARATAPGSQDGVGVGGTAARVRSAGLVPPTSEPVAGCVQWTRPVGPLDSFPLGLGNAEPRARRALGAPEAMSAYPGL